MEAVKQGSATIGIKSSTHVVLVALKVCSHRVILLSHMLHGGTIVLETKVISSNVACVIRESSSIDYIIMLRLIFHSILLCSTNIILVESCVLLWCMSNYAIVYDEFIQTFFIA